MKRLVLALFLVSCSRAPAPDRPAGAVATPDACGTDDPGTCLAEARTVFAQGDDAERAAAMMESACRAGVGEACSDLGMRLENGRGVPKDDAKAFALYQRGDAANDPTSSARAGLMIVHGKAGSNQDLGEAARLLEKGCDGKLDWACFKLGTAYAGGHLGDRDLPAALQAFEKACHLDHGEACFVSSQMLARGQGALADPAQAEAFAKRACSLGVARACD